MIVYFVHPPTEKGAGKPVDPHAKWGSFDSGVMDFYKSWFCEDSDFPIMSVNNKYVFFSKCKNNFVFPDFS